MFSLSFLIPACLILYCRMRHLNAQYQQWQTVIIITSECLVLIKYSCKINKALLDRFSARFIKNIDKISHSCSPKHWRKSPWHTGGKKSYKETDGSGAQSPILTYWVNFCFRMGVTSLVVTLMAVTFNLYSLVFIPMYRRSPITLKGGQAVILGWPPH